MGLALFGHKVVHTELEIEAPPAAVWSVLSDASSHESWNPTFVRVEGQYEVGAELINHVRDGSDKVVAMKSKVTRMEETRELRQFGGIYGVLTFEHQWLLHPTDDGGTRVVQHEEYRGIGAWFWDESWVEPAYARANAALREHVLGRLGATDDAAPGESD